VGQGCSLGNRPHHVPGISPNCNKVYAQISDFSGLQQELRQFFHKAKGSGIDKSKVLVVVIVHNSAKVMREGTKWWGDVFTGLATQVLVSDMNFYQVFCT
jgi:hypothetical protein